MSYQAQNVGYQADILPLFTQTDIEHMNNEGINLADYATVKGASGIILQRLQAPAPNTMPPPPEGPWPAGEHQLFQTWINQGCQP